MVAIVNRKLLVACLITVCIGCDNLPGPVLRNEFHVPITVSIAYEDGTRYSEDWPVCRLVSIGGTIVGGYGLRKSSAKVQEIVIEVEGKIAHQFSSSEIAELLDLAEKQPGPEIWVVDPLGIRFSQDDLEGQCRVPE